MQFFDFAQDGRFVTPVHAERSAQRRVEAGVRWFGGCGLFVLLLAPACAVLRSADTFVSATAGMEVAWRRHLSKDVLIDKRAREFLSEIDTRRLSPQEFAGAASDGNWVYAGSRSGDFYALDAHSGKVRWRRSLDGPVGAAPLIGSAEGVVFVGTESGTMHALELATGKERWSYATKGAIQTVPAYGEGLLFFSSGEERVYALDAATGRRKWQYDRESPEGFTVRGRGAPFWWQRNLYVGFADGNLVCLSASTGDMVWQKGLSGEAKRFTDVDTTPTVVEGTLYAAAYSGGVYALDPKDGALRWHHDLDGVSSLSVGGGRVILSSSKSGVHCLDDQGHPLWQQEIGRAGELSPPLLVRNMVMVSTTGGGLYIVDAEGGQLAGYFPPGHGATAAPTTDGKQLYLLTNNGYLYAFSMP